MSNSTLSQKWNFEQGDSRRPGEIRNVFVGDDIMEEEENSIMTSTSKAEGQSSGISQKESILKEEKVEEKTNTHYSFSQLGTKELRELDSFSQEYDRVGNRRKTVVGTQQNSGLVTDHSSHIFLQTINKGNDSSEEIIV